MFDLYTVMKSVDIDLSDVQIKQFNIFYEMLIETNKVMNLTAITDYDGVAVKHFADSAAIHNVYDMTKVRTVIDVGTGAGFPGIVLKIIYPWIEILLLDSLNKRVNFLNRVIDALGLKNIHAVHGRAEDIAHNNLYREKYDLCVSRAVAGLPVLSEYCLPFVRTGGAFVSYKASGCHQEICDAENAIRLLGGSLTNATEYNLESELVRIFVIIDKIKPTPSKYPRKAGIPSKEPLR